MWSLLLVLLLVACSRELAGTCRLQPIADLPVTLEPNRLVEVSGRVNRSDVQLVIDTGAERTVLSAGTVKFLMLARSQHSITRLEGVGGTVSNADVYADLELGGAYSRQRLAEASIPGIGGLVGDDILSDYDVEFDLPNQRFRLWHATGCGAGDLPWTGPRTTIPVDLTGGERLRVPVTIDGKTIETLLDSGAAISVMQTEAALRLGVTLSALAADPELLVRGVDGSAIRLRIHRFGLVSVGNDLLTGPLIGVGDIQPSSPELLLGLDYLRQRKVWISYRTERIFVQ
jgi:hypothetical protein